MLKQLHIEYKDGTEKTELIHLEPGEQVKLFPQDENIKFANCKTFKYRVEKHPYISTPIIVKLGNKYKIMPHNIECHPKTTLDDIYVYEKRKNKKREKRNWTFMSSSGMGTYTVTRHGERLFCTCPGVWRVKDRRCKHIKEVELELK